MKVPVRFVSLLVSVSLLTAVLMLGPAQAFLLELSTSKTVSLFGEAISFILSARIDPGEVKDIHNLMFKLTSPQILECTFLPDGTPVSPCPGITIVRLENTSSFGYGYGFFPGRLKYNLTLDPAALTAGTYKPFLTVMMNDSNITTVGQNISILKDLGTANGCSVRAKDGSASFEGRDFNARNKLTLFVPGKGAREGLGELVLQKGNDRLVYKFKVNESFRVDATHLLFHVSGNVSTNRTSSVREKSTILVDTGSSLAQVNGTRVDISDMAVTFVKCQKVKS